MGSHGAAGKGGGGKENGKPGTADPGPAAVAAESAVDVVGWVVPEGKNKSNKSPITQRCLFHFTFRSYRRHPY